MTRTVIIALCLVFVLSASKCKEEIADTSCSNFGVVEDLTGLDGCGLVIKLNDEMLEVVSWPDNSQVTAGDEIFFDFKTIDGGSICMVGKMVEVTCLKKK
jgi:hypothetical protein